MLAISEAIAHGQRPQGGREGKGQGAAGGEQVAKAARRPLILLALPDDCKQGFFFFF
ncbi:hypothetical protein PPACK8108_LOCUS3196 [Phakopsora pachyrhizi]|uniref:Uncharacterized protein n=1 Tax=Phakopsora pachyrhizi TaxID=170000 RepID=A0AAV0AJH7_PHAPC|nr:hypothetical protein PPACK8108_LOCUS3196 [Phakopsora pachyrhizi]